MSGGAVPVARSEDYRRFTAYVQNGRNFARASLSLDIPPSTLKSWWHTFKAEHGPDGPADPLWFTLEHQSEPIISAPLAKPVVRVRAVTTETPPDGPIRRVVAIGDLHQKPGRSPERFKWIGRYVADQKPDNVVAIGDVATLDSMSLHEKPGSRAFYERGTFADDIEDLDHAMSLYHAECGSDIPHDLTYGNHEDRAWRAEESSPNLKDTLVLPIEQLFSRYGWQTHLYGKWIFKEGVGFTHCPRNSLGREYGGKQSENAIGNDAIFSCVWGHSHKALVKQVPKIGPSKGISLVNLGTAMPQGEIEHYAGLSMTGWTYGIFLLSLQAGRVVSHHFTAMSELQERYQ